MSRIEIYSTNGARLFVESGERGDIAVEVAADAGPERTFTVLRAMIPDANRAALVNACLGVQHPGPMERWQRGAPGPYKPPDRVTFVSAFAVPHPEQSVCAHTLYGLDKRGSLWSNTYSAGRGWEGWEPFNMPEGVA